MLNMFKRLLSGGSKETVSQDEKRSKLERTDGVDIASPGSPHTSTSKPECKTEDARDEDNSDGSSSSSGDTESESSDSSSDTEDEVELPDETPEWGKIIFNSVEKGRKDIKQLKSCTRKVKRHSRELAEIKTRMTNLELNNERLTHENVDLKEKLLDLEYRSRRNNLVFEGISESDASEGGYDCFLKVCNVVKFCGIDTKTFKVDRCHRLGVKSETNQKFPRPFICCFNWYGDLTTVLSNRKNLPKHVFVNEDLPEEWNDRRRVLRPIFNTARKVQNLKGKVHWSKDSLVIAGKKYSSGPKNNLAELEGVVDASLSCQRKGESCVVFKGIHSVFSNFYPADFNLDGNRYRNCEQYLQAKKAECANDEYHQQKIMSSSNPFLIKRLGNRVKPTKKWTSEVKSVAYKCIREKFAQNPGLKTQLLATENLKLVEGTKDQFWGIGMNLSEQGATDPTKWTGDGLMCEILSRVRAEFKDVNKAP